MTNYEKQQLINSIEKLSENKCTKTIDDKELYCSIITGLVSVKGYATEPSNLKKKADEIYLGIKGTNLLY